jgi:hypothetical protein
VREADLALAAPDLEVPGAAGEVGIVASEQEDLGALRARSASSRPSRKTS